MKKVIDLAKIAITMMLSCRSACTEQTASLALQAALGFEQVACFREVGYKFGRWLDVVYMQLFLDGQESSRA